MADSVPDSEMQTAENRFLTSEDNYIIHCDPCKYENIKTKAVGHCYTCKEHLCKHCLQLHRKFRAFKDHNIIIGDFQQEGKVGPLQTNPLNQSSSQGTRKEHICCCYHDYISCKESNVEKQSTFNFHPSQHLYKENHHENLEHVIQDIENLKTEFEKLKISSNKRKNAVQGVSQKCKIQLNVMRAQMSDFFDTLEKEIDTVELQQMSWNEDLRENLAIYNEATNHILSFAEHMQQNFQSSASMAIVEGESNLNNPNTCITKTNASEDMFPKSQSEINMVFQNMSNNICEKERKIHTANTASDTQSRNHIHHSQEDPMNQPLTECTQNDLSTVKEKSFKNLKIRKKFLTAINDDESSSCNITDSVFLPNDHLVLCDNANSIVMLLDKNFKVIDTLKVETSPWGVALLDIDKIAVTLPDYKKLMYIKIDAGKLVQTETVLLQGVCWGICVHNGDLIITYKDSNEAYVEIRKIDGKKVKTFPIKNKETNVSYFYVSSIQVKNKGYIYISDGKSTLFRYSLGGYLLSKFQHEKIEQPRKVIVDDNDDCIVCSGKNMKLIHVTHKPRSTQEMWKGSDIFKVWMKQNRNPQMMSMRWNDLTLVVGHESKNHIQVVQLYRGET